jgi:hypothetical protein
VPSAPQTLDLVALDDQTIRAMWTAPSSVNGDAIRGYKVYVDDGIGGPFTLVFDGSNYPSTYRFDIENLTCGLNYFVQVSALNVAGEGSKLENKLWFGQVPSEPLNPQWV